MTKTKQIVEQKCFSTLSKTNLFNKQKRETKQNDFCYQLSCDFAKWYKQRQSLFGGLDSNFREELTRFFIDSVEEAYQKGREDLKKELLEKLPKEIPWEQARWSPELRGFNRCLSQVKLLLK